MEQTMNDERWTKPIERWRSELCAKWAAVKWPMIVKDIQRLIRKLHADEKQVKHQTTRMKNKKKNGNSIEYIEMCGVELKTRNRSSCNLLSHTLENRTLIYRLRTISACYSHSLHVYFSVRCMRGIPNKFILKCILQQHLYDTQPSKPAQPMWNGLFVSHWRWLVEIMRSYPKWKSIERWNIVSVCIIFHSLLNVFNYAKTVII